MTRKICIMVVDDEQTERHLLDRILTQEGYDVILAADGSSSLIQMEELSPDLVILDVMMPGLNGFQVLKTIRQRSNVPVIMLSARGELANVRDALDLGADDFVRKPFQRGELLARIKAKLRRAGAEVAMAN